MNDRQLSQLVVLAAFTAGVLVGLLVLKLVQDAIHFGI